LIAESKPFNYSEASWWGEKKKSLPIFFQTMCLDNGQNVQKITSGFTQSTSLEKYHFQWVLISGNILKYARSDRFKLNV